MDRICGMFTAPLPLPGSAPARSARHLLLRKLAQFAALPDDQKLALDRALSARVQSVGRGIPIIEAGEAPADIFVVLEGWACSVRPTIEGRPPIIALHLPGDICDLGALMKRHMDCTIYALTPVKVAALGRSAVARLTRDHPQCAQALWWESMCAAAIRGQWVARLGNGSAKARIANLLCELATRLYVVGLADDGGFDLPITQTDIGLSCGLTPEHTNRVLRDLREKGAIAWEKGRLAMLDWDILRSAASFDARYLHFRDLKTGDVEEPSEAAGSMMVRPVSQETVAI